MTGALPMRESVTIAGRAERVAVARAFVAGLLDGTSRTDAGHQRTWITRSAAMPCRAPTGSRS
jgi:hypothetical protein